MRHAEFFSYARARHAIYLARQSGQDGPWTDDPILQRYRFCNVFRELDRTTIWFRENVRDRLDRHPMCEALVATILFRTLNRIESGDVMFSQGQLPLTGSGDPIGWAYVTENANIGDVEGVLRSALPRGPWVTGSYIVKTPDGMDKLRGALWIVEEARKRAAGTVAALASAGAPQASLEALWRALQAFPFIGPFTGYEIVTDMRHQYYWRDAPDIMTWANAGPGAIRGLNRLHGRELRHPLRQTQACAEMRTLLFRAGDPDYWVQQKMPIAERTWETAKFSHMGPDWHMWEMRDVEHTLCEWDKYERARLGEGRPRGTYP